MAKSYSLAFVSLFLLLFGSCQSIEQISIDYLQSADLSFPPQLRKVAIVNNASNAPDDKLTPQTKKSKDNRVEISRAIAYANGDPKVATEAMAEEIAHQNYFDEVVICDSALRTNDKISRESTLSQEEVRQLASDLRVDLIIALENLQFKITKTVRYLEEFGCYQGAIDAKVYPTVSVYLPERSKPMATIRLNDSIFWEDFGISPTEAAAQIIPTKDMLKEAAEFAGTVPVKYIVPIWKNGKRYLYTGGSVPMRDAAIYVRENSWDEAYELWNQAYQSTKNEKKKMRAALNIAVYYEMKDSLAKAEKWATTAQQHARKTELKKNTGNNKINTDEAPNYFYISLYLTELKERNAQLSKLKLQMSRFNDDF